MAALGIPDFAWPAAASILGALVPLVAPPDGVDATVDVVPELVGNVWNTIAFGHHRMHDRSLVPAISARVAPGRSPKRSMSSSRRCSSSSSPLQLASRL